MKMKTKLGHVKMNDNLELVVCILKDVLGEMKAAQVERDEIAKELVRFDMMKDDEDDEIDYNGIFHPNKMINEIVKTFVGRYKKKRRVETMLEQDDPQHPNAEVVDSNSSSAVKAITIPSVEKVLVSLVNIYPDVDQMFLRQVCVKLHFDATKIQDWLEKNISTIPERRQVQAIHRACLESSCGADEELWSCPGCNAWHLVQRNSSGVFSCKEIVSCGEFCSQCDRKEHSPFPCRPRIGRVNRAYNGVDIFEKLKTKPDEEKGFAKIFVLDPDNNLDFSNPRHILYLVAEGACHRMMDTHGCTSLHPASVPTSSQAVTHVRGPWSYQRLATLQAPPTQPSAASSGPTTAVDAVGPQGPGSATNLSVINYQPSSQVSTVPSIAATISSQVLDRPSHATNPASTGISSLPFPAWPSDNRAGSSLPTSLHFQATNNCFTKIKERRPRGKHELALPSASNPSPLKNGDQFSSLGPVSSRNVQSGVATNIQHYPQFYQNTLQTAGGVPSNILPPPAQLSSGARFSKVRQQILALRQQARHNRMCISTIPEMNLEKKKFIKYIEAESLRARFQACKSSFVSRGIPDTERLVFHGTNADLDSIIEHNFRLDLCKRSAHGKGFYFSEFLHICKNYGQKILLCRVIVGNSYEGSENQIPPQYQSKVVQIDHDGKAKMIIIDNADQILPAFIIEGF